MSVSKELAQGVVAKLQAAGLTVSYVPVLEIQREKIQPATNEVGVGPSTFSMAGRQIAMDKIPSVIVNAYEPVVGNDPEAASDTVMNRQDVIVAALENAEMTADGRTYRPIAIVQEQPYDAAYITNGAAVVGSTAFTYRS